MPSNPADQLANATGFEWDDGNRDKNRGKHGVNRDEVEQVFDDPQLLLSEDALHSNHEERFILLGATELGRRLSVVFTFRGTLIRVISARDMTRRERSLYDDET